MFWGRFSDFSVKDSDSFIEAAGVGGSDIDPETLVESDSASKIEDGWLSKPPSFCKTLGLKKPIRLLCPFPDCPFPV
jgi:hypothetical protein